MRLKRALAAALAVAAAVVATGCASGNHSWRSEFTARLDGARASVEETLAEVGPDATETEDFTSYANLGRELRYKGELIEELDAPQGCAAVQIKGLDHVKSSGRDASGVGGPGYAPKLLKADRVSLENEVRVLARLKREAEACE